MFYGTGADEGQVAAGNMLIVITFFILIKLMVRIDAGSFKMPGLYIHLTVKPDHVFAYFLEAPDQ